MNASVRSKRAPTSCQSEEISNLLRSASSKQKLTAALPSSADASPRSWKTSSFFTGTIFSNACCNSPSCVFGGSPRNLTLRARISLVRLTVFATACADGAPACSARLSLRGFFSESLTPIFRFLYSWPSRARAARASA
jgi:hypothetical protein